MSSRAARSGLHVCLSSLLLISAILPTMIPSAVLAESPDGIIVEDADWVGIAPLEPSPPMPDVSPRIVVEYGGFIRRGGLEGTTALPDIPARIIVEYGGSIRKSSLEGTTDLPDVPARIIVEYGDSVVRNDLQGTTAMPHTSPRIIVASASSIVHASLTPMTEEPSPPPVIPGFLTLPSDGPDIKIQQGWRYTAPIGPNPTDPYAHNGIDYVTGVLNQPATWQPFDVVAAADGVAMQSSGGGYGDFVLIRHDETDTGGRNYFTLYAHLGAVEDNTTYREDRFATDYENWTPVTRGQKIGVAGDTGSPGLVHLHFEVQRGSYAQNKVDPYDIYETRDYYPGGPVYAGCGANALWMESVCPPPEQFEFTIGDWVRATANLNVREGPGLGHSVIKTMPLGATAQVLGGPILTDGFFWWDVEYAVGVRGWSVENWLELHVSGAPTCVVRLQMDGAAIDEVGIWELFDIYVGDSYGDTDIAQVRFSSDHIRDSYPTGRWTDWIDWNISRDDWDAATKIKRWAFDTPGYKEVWAELKDGKGHTAVGLATIFVPAPALPVLTSPLVISPAKDIYSVEDSLEAEFAIVNIGVVPITLDVLTVGGRLNGFAPPGGAPDFTFRSVTLLPNQPYQYQGTLELDQTGQYSFFIAYHIENPTLDEQKLLDENNWSTCVELGEGLSNAGRVKHIAVCEEGIVPEKASELRTEIDRWKEHRLRYQYPAYLRSAGSFTDSVATLWTSFTSWVTRTDLTRQYDDLYSTGIEYQSLSFQTLMDADGALESGEVEAARKFLESSHRYSKLSEMSFSSAAEVFLGSLEAGMILAKGIKDGCQAAVSVGVKIVYPPAATKVDSAYTAIDFVVTTMIEGWDQATKDLITTVIVKQLFKHVTFTFLDGSTLEDYVNTVRTKVTLVELLKNEAFLEEFGQALQMIIMDSVVVETGIEFGEKATEELVSSITDYLLSTTKSLWTEVRSPVQLRVLNSGGQVTGLTDKGVRHEIPMSLYDDGTVVVFFPADIYRYEVVGTGRGTYELETASTRGAEAAAFACTGIPTSADALHLYTIDWDTLAQGGAGITIEKDYDGDGEVDEIIITGIPEAPVSPFPADSATGISLNTTLSWTGSNYVTYNVHVGTLIDPPLVSERQAETTYLPMLQPYSRYYWRVAAINEHSISSTGSAWSFITQGAGIVGEIRDVSCDILYGVNITLYHHGEVMPTAFSDVGGSYVVRVLDPGQYELVASKDGFRDVRQWIEVTQLGHEYEVHFRADHGLIPTAPNMSYVLACINLWQFGEPQCKLTMSTALAVINAWQFPIEEEAVHFADPNLEAAIREAIHKPTGPIYPPDLAVLASLDAFNRNIVSLAGLEYCTGLTYLCLGWNQISDIQVLSNLNSLTSLSLSHNQIVDIQVLSNLNSLTSLSLGWNQISDIQALSNLNSLTNLGLWGNQICDISPLANLTNLTELNLRDNQISDIEAMSNLSNLRDLGLGENQISDVEVLSNLISLTQLVLEENQISDIQALSTLTSLTSLQLQHNQIGDISPLAGLTKLTRLLLFANQIDDISPLASLANLEWLYVYGNLVTDVSPLAALTDLTQLDLSYNQIGHISSLANLVALTYLSVSWNQLTDISPLAGLTELTWLYLDGNQISDIYPLVDNDGLGTGDRVYLEGNPLSEDSINIYIPELQARGVNVHY